jgi:hypothetical protein
MADALTVLPAAPWDVSLGRSGCYMAVGSQDSGLTGGRLTAHRVVLGLLPLLIDLRVLPRERIRDRVGFLQSFMHPELVVRFAHVPPDHTEPGWPGSPALRRSAMHGRVTW